MALTILVIIGLIVLYCIFASIIRTCWSEIRENTGIIFNKIKKDDDNPERIYYYNDYDSSIEKYFYREAYISSTNILVNLFSFIPVYTKKMDYYYCNNYHISEKDIERLLNKEISIEDLYNEREKIEDDHYKTEHERENKIDEINKQFNELIK